MSVSDPCLDAVIVVSDITSIMQAPILGTHELDSLNLYSELAPYWPWIDSVTMQANYLPDLCGPIEYFITDAAFAPTDLVVFSDDMSTLHLQPTLAHAPGGRMVDLKLVARLRDYPEVQIGYDSFKVYIMDCQASIDPTLVMANLQKQPINWGASPVPYDISNVLDMYGQSPSCQY